MEFSRGLHELREGPKMSGGSRTPRLEKLTYAKLDLVRSDIPLCGVHT
jgi:hypothetical protein